MNQADSSTTVLVRDSAAGEWRDLITFPYGDEGNMIDFSQDGKSCLVLSSLGRETTALVRLDAQSMGSTIRIRSRDAIGQ